MLVDTLWNPLETFAVPAHVFKSGKLTVNFSELAVYLIACKRASVYQSGCLFELPLREIAAVTGYTPRQILTAINKLQTLGLLKKYSDERERDAVGKLENITYELCDSKGDGLHTPGQRDRLRVGLRAKLCKLKQPYFALPSCTIDYLSELRGAPLAVYVAAVRLCNLKGQREVTASVVQLRKLAGIARNETMSAALDDVLYPVDGVHRHFLQYRSPNKRTITVTLTNPSDPQSLPLEYYEITEQETGKVTTRRKEYDDDLLLRWAAAAIWHGASPDVLKLGSNGDHLGTCPMCGGCNAKRRGVPTLAINVARRSAQNAYGIYFCHSCGAGAGETLLDLVMQRTGLNVIKAMASLEKLKSESQVTQ